MDGITLPEALRVLHETAKAPVALIVDEAQHALTSEAGEATMSALKSARDQLNQPGSINLMLVMSGSDRDKLLRLVNTNGSPFHGSQIRRMPPLGEDFIQHICELIAKQRPELMPIDGGTLMNAFEGLEQAVLWRLLDQAQFFRPYDNEALRFYQACTGSRVTAQQAQRALESLRERTPARVWKSARGEYAVDDAAMHRWFEKRVQAGTWPPVNPQGTLGLEEDKDEGSQLPVA